jgi:hypothetical protein
MSNVLLISLVAILCILILYSYEEVKFWLHMNVAKRCKLCSCSNYYRYNGCNCICHKEFDDGSIES